MFAESLEGCQSVPEAVAAICSWPELWKESRFDEVLENSNRQFDLENGLALLAPQGFSETYHPHAGDTAASS
jgi:hypothetical protein